VSNEIDVTKIKPGDLVKIDVRWSISDPWLSIKVWHEVTENGNHLCAAGQVIRWSYGEPADFVRVRAHKPAPTTSIPTIPGTRFRATVRGVPDQIVMVSYSTELPYVTAAQVVGRDVHGAEDITDVHDVVLP